MKRRFKISFSLFLILALTGVYFYSCQRADDLYTLNTSEEQLIGEYLESNDSLYSEFVNVLQLTNNLSFLKAYGAYTCFAPTNSAFEKYAQKHGKASMEDFSEEELSDLVKYHIINDTINSTLFTDGRLPSVNLYGHFLTAKASFDSQTSKFTYKINKYAPISKLNQSFPNGIIHTVDQVIEPVKQSVVQLIENDPAYSIFNKALKETGIYDILSEISDQSVPAEDRVWFTLFAQSDAVYKNAGINSYDELKSKYSSIGDPKNPADSLYLYMAYHCLPNNLQFVADLVLQQAFVTMAPLEVITIKVDGEEVLINEDVFNGILEEGYPIDRENSDNTAANGVVHFVDGDFYIKFRVPFPVYWDVTDQPELRKNLVVFRKPAKSLVIEPGALAGITWGSQNTISYESTGGAGENEFIYGDYLRVALRTAVVPWIEFTTPLLVKGRYKVWTCTRNVFGGRRPKWLVTFDETQQLPTVIDENYTLPRDPRYETDEELEARGFKRYNYELADSATYFTLWKGVFVGQLAGIIDVETTGNHKIRFDVLNNTDGGMWLDQIHFIPEDMNQIWPRVKQDGTLIYEPEVPFPHEKPSTE